MPYSIGPRAVSAICPPSRDAPADFPDLAVIAAKRNARRNRRDRRCRTDEPSRYDGHELMPPDEWSGDDGYNAKPGELIRIRSLLQLRYAGRATTAS